MSTDDTISIKEFIHMKFSELGDKIDKIEVTSFNALEKITVLEAKQQTKKEEEMKQDAELKEKNNKIRWRLGVLIPLGIGALGYFGFLYIEHIKTEIIAITSANVLTLMEGQKSDFIKETSENVVSILEYKYNLELKK